MKNRLLDKRIPTLLGIILIIVGVGITSFLVTKGVIFNSNATPSQNPENVKIANLTDTSFTVTYVTSDNVFGSVNYGTSPALGQTALDDRDSLTRAIVPHRVHSISVNNLEPSTTYYFSITSSENKYENGGKPFSVTTGPQIENNPSDQKPASGKVIQPDGNPPSEALVYLFSDNNQIISTLLKTDGSYLIPLNSLRTWDLTSYASISANTKLKIVIAGNTKTSNVIINANQINPVPTITLSNNYDFSSNPSAGTANQSSQVASVSGFPSSDHQNSNFVPTILSPKADEGFSDNQPKFDGTAQPNEAVTITIHSDAEITATITSDSNGNWTYRPTQPLSPGKHTITIKTKDASGIIKTITQNFTVYAAGTQFTTSPGPTGFSSPSPIPIVSPSPSSAPILIPTPSPTPSVTSVPSPAIIIQATPQTTSSSKTTLPPTGISSLPLALIGVILTIAGFIVLIFSRKSFRF